MTENNMDDKVIDKVRKALALANDNPNDSEAHTAMLLAQRLLAKNGLTLKDVEGEQESLKKVVQENIIPNSGRIPWWKKQLAMVISDNFKCKCFTVNYGNYNSAIAYFGLEDDVMIAKEVYQYAENILDKLATRYVQKLYRDGKETKGMRNEYMYGFMNGLKEKFKEQVEKNDWGLIIVTDALVEQRYSEKKFRKASSSGIQPGFSGSNEARSEGYKEGQNFADAQSRTGIE